MSSSSSAYFYTRWYFCQAFFLFVNLNSVCLHPMQFYRHMVAFNDVNKWPILANFNCLIAIIIFCVCFVSSYVFFCEADTKQSDNISLLAQLFVSAFTSVHFGSWQPVSKCTRCEQYEGRVCTCFISASKVALGGRAHSIWQPSNQCVVFVDHFTFFLFPCKSAVKSALKESLLYHSFKRFLITAHVQNQ